MNKNEAMERLDAIEREAKELRRIIEAPEWKPEDLVGKLCYVWDDYGAKQTSVIKELRGNSRFIFSVGGNCFMYAEPVPAAEVEKMIYRKSRYDWSKAPVDAKIAVTNEDGSVCWGTFNNATPTKSGWRGVEPGAWNWDAPHGDPRDWRDSLERRP